ncbi:hypothetical protein FBY03_106162 [Pseudomonas sp. SJZ079]|uniref:hypothetical protein n=1 Tax=Pseudomonas sp. SJZ079 TaxID=2572887 RepID=UPI001199047D|nr:hypothetical protein [Pseudomonas sp. SJZ079]TWC38663.1 hypothetical protein FBY03_106162 [Pseudomonas sp. SJZ079]
MTATRFFPATDRRVIYLYQRDPQEALERLNRITGLRFAHWPESLVQVPGEGQEIRAQAQEQGESVMRVEVLSG